MRARGWIGRHNRSVYQALILDGSELSNFIINVRNEATMDAYGYDCISAVCILAVCITAYHIGVRLRVARSTLMGNAKASNRGMSN